MRDFIIRIGRTGPRSSGAPLRLQPEAVTDFD